MSTNKQHVHLLAATRVVATQVQHPRWFQYATRESELDASDTTSEYWRLVSGLVNLKLGWVPQGKSHLSAWHSSQPTTFEYLYTRQPNIIGETLQYELYSNHAVAVHQIGPKQDRRLKAYNVQLGTVDEFLEAATITSFILNNGNL